VQDVPEPKVAGRFVRIKIHAAPMCTEFHSFKEGRLTSTLGHEAAGEVVECGPQACVNVGDRVVVMPQNGCGVCPLCLSGEHIHCRTPLDPLKVCASTTGRATYAQYCIQQDWLLTPIPEGCSYLHGSMACCGLGPSFTAVQRMVVGANDTVLIAGLGPVGLGAVINATHQRARVIALELNPYRGALARQLGAEAVVDPTAPDAVKQILELTGGVGADKAIETSNVASSPPLLVQALRPRGQLALISWAGQVDVPKIVDKGLVLHGAWHWNHRTQAREMFNVIQRNIAKLDQLITHQYALNEVERAFETQMTGKCGKVVLNPWA
jgi:threonine dehydrogenase-like Zn-dependent dehydrogenase